MKLVVEGVRVTYGLTCFFMITLYMIAIKYWADKIGDWNIVKERSKNLLNILVLAIKRLKETVGSLMGASDM